MGSAPLLDAQKTQTLRCAGGSLEGDKFMPNIRAAA
jgi:hypothetical protein